MMPSLIELKSGTEFRNFPPAKYCATLLTSLLGEEKSDEAAVTWPVEKTC